MADKIGIIHKRGMTHNIDKDNWHMDMDMDEIYNIQTIEIQKQT